MRTYNLGDTGIQYPDIVSFCFNPTVINISSPSWKHIIMSISCGGSTITEKRETFNGNCFFDASFYMQTMFDKSDFSVNYSSSGAKDSNMGKLFTISLEFVGDDNSDYFEFTTFSIWGAMQIGERYNGDRELTWFKNFPFTVGLYTAAGATLSYQRNNGQVGSTVISGRGTWNVILPQGLSESDLTIVLPGNTSNPSVFDQTFDYTFQGLANTATNIKIKVDDSENGVYLRWVNRHGMYCYWLFVKGDRNNQVSQDGEFVRNNMQDYNYVNGYHGGTGRRQKKQDTCSVAVCAPLVDSSTYDFLYELALSPVIDMYVQNANNWVGVNVSVDSFIKTSKSLQDFTASIILPESRVASL